MTAQTDTAPASPRLPAATLMLLRDGAAGTEVLISQRTAKTSFVPSMYVFPGGRVDADEAEWAQHWTAHCPAAWPALTRQQALAAVRECFEEMGLLLACDAQGQAIAPAVLAGLQRQQPLWPQLAALGLRPQLEALAWVCDRLPPASFKRPFHTAFFMALAPQGQSVAPDMQEQINAVWLPLHKDDWQDRQRYPMIAPTEDALHSLQAQQHGGAAAMLAQAHAAPLPAPFYWAREATQQGDLLRLTPEHIAYAEVEMRSPDGSTVIALDWQYSQPVALNAVVQRLTCANASHMTGPGTNTYLLGRPEQGFIVIDAGPRHKAHMRHILQATGGRIHALICTHSHPDHSPGAELLQRFYRSKGQTLPLLGMASLPTAPAHSIFKPSHPVGHGSVLELPAAAGQPALRLRCIHTPGHAANHLCLLLEGWGILFSGDQLLSGSTTVIAPPDGDMQAYMDSLDDLDAVFAEHRVHYILPAHGHVLGGWATTDPELPQPAGAGAQRITAYYRAHRLKREAKIIAAMQQTGIRDNSASSRATLLPLAYDDAPPALWPVAEGSLAAHIDRILSQQLLSA